MSKRRENYWKEYYQKSPKAKERSKRQAEKKRAEYQALLATLPKCKLCGEPLSRRAMSSRTTQTLLIHQKCDPVAWVTEWRLRNPNWNKKRKDKAQ